MKNHIKFFPLLFMTLFVLYFSCGQPPWSGLNGEKIKIIKAEELQNKLNESRGHFVILHYWATWCTSCIPEMKSFASLQEKFKDKGLRIIGVSIDNPKDEKRVNLAEETYNNAGELYGQYISREEPRTIMTVVDPDFLDIIPITYLINGEGTVIKKFMGSRSFAELELHINSLYR